MPEKNRRAVTRTDLPDDYKTKPTLDLTRTIAKDIFKEKTTPWDAIHSISGFVNRNGMKLSYDEYDEIAENVWVHISAYLSPSAKVESPTIICGGARICHHAHVSSSVIGAFAIVGDHSTVKNSIMFDRSKLMGHNALISSILGYESVLGNGSMVADARLDGMNVTINMPEGLYITGRGRLGAVICDDVKIGSTCVINPGTVIDGGTTVYPLTSVSGYIHPYSTVK